MNPNLALNLAPFSRWTLRDKAAQRRLALRWASQMRVPLILIFVFISAPLSAFSQDGATPAAQSFKGMELYSWKDSASDSWLFSLLSGTNRNKVLAEIKEPSGVIPNVDQLEERLATLAEGERVFWFLAGLKPELSYPDQETVSRVIAFAVKHQITLVIE